MDNFTDMSFLISHHESNLSNPGAELENGHSNSSNMSVTVTKIIYLTIPGPSAPVELSPSNRVHIQDLAENPCKIFEGKYLLCRVIAPIFKPYHSQAIRTIVDDPVGQQTILLTLLNCDSFTSDVLFVGSVLAIKNPTFKSVHNKNKNGLNKFRTTTETETEFRVRCDNPVNVELISEKFIRQYFNELTWKGEIPQQWRHLYKSHPQTTLEWKNKGDKLSEQKYIRTAIWCYTEGLLLLCINLQEDLSSKLSLMLCRARAFMGIGCFNKSLEDSENALRLTEKINIPDVSPDDIRIFQEEGIFLKVKSLSGLQRFKEASSFLQSFEKNSEGKLAALIDECQVMERQRICGEYDMVTLHENADEVISTYEYKRNDLADFVIPFELKTIPGKGRGLFTNQEIQPGQLVMVSKSFVAIFSDSVELQCVRNKKDFINTETKIIKNSDQIKLIHKIGEKLILEPELGPDVVYPLFAGPDLPEFVKKPYSNSISTVLDLRRIDCICSYNPFSGNEYFRSKPSHSGGRMGELTLTCGLWILPSYINHSCWDCNCIWQTFGDVMFVRAFKKISAGEEILISYISPSYLYGERMSQVMDKHGFICECQLCVLDRDDSEMGRRRSAILAEIQDLDNFQGQSYQEKMINLINELNSLDLGHRHQSLNPSLLNPFFHLMEYFSRRRDWNKSLEYLAQAYTLTENSPLLRRAVQATSNRLTILLVMRNLEEAKKCAKVLKRDVLILSGTLGILKIVAKYT